MADKELFGNSEQLDCSDCVNHGGDWECDHIHCRKSMDTISRREALDALTKQADEMSRWCERYQEQRKGVLTARNIIKDLPSAQQWIPCKERLPKESQNVLTIDRYGDYEINHIIDGDEWYWEPSPVAWCPLPEPYKEEQP